MKSSRYALAAQIGLLFVLIIALTWTGIAVRKQTWERTEVLRYKPDMENAWHWGSQAAKEGYFQLYQSVIDAHKESKEKDYGLDYVPLRLAVMTVWAKSKLAQANPPRSWQADYAFNAPLLHFNTVMEFLAGAGIFVLVRQWSRRDDQRQTIQRRWLRAECLALIAFSLVWFNPAALLSAHARPTWDVWVTPFFVWAIWLCACDWWLLAGVVLAVGAMFKGQEMIVAPVFLLWPLMGLRFGAAFRFLLGFVLSAAVIVSPWIVGARQEPIAFVIGLAALPAATYALLRFRPIRGWSMPARWLRWLIPVALAAGLVASVPLFHGSMAWFKIGYVYGADKFEGLEAGGASSLAGILGVTYGWSYDDPLFVLPHTSITVTITEAMIAAYALCLIAIAWAMRRYERAGDARFLLATAAVWIVYFAIFPRMHERYLLWGALCACAATAVGSGQVLLAIFFSLCSTIMSLFQMLPRPRANEFLPELGPHFGRMLHDFVRPTFPHIGWAILMATAVWMWLVVAGAAGARKTPGAAKPLPARSLDQ